MRVVTEDPGAASVFVDEWRHLSPPRRDEVLRRRDRYESRFREAIADGTADGTFAFVDPAVAATFLLTAVNGISGWYRTDGHLGPAQLADAYADLAIRALTEERL